METELKFEVDPAAAERLARRLALARRGKTVALRSIYFDTPDARLNAEGVALRIREEGGRYTQTVKTVGPGLGLERGEWDAQVKGHRLDLAAAANTPLAKALNGGAALLRPAFETRVERRMRRLRYDGGLVEAALDRGVVDAGAHDEPILELELELKRGRVDALFGLARELAQVAPMNLSFASKAERGYALLDGEPLAPVRTSDPRLDRDDTAASAFKAIAGSALAQIAANARVLRHERRIEALHQLRVGARRLRSAISLFRPMLEDSQLAGIKGELKWLTRELDDARNLDVFIIESFRPAAKRHARSMGLSNLGRALITAQTRAYDRAEAALGSERCRVLMLETAAWIETGVWTASEDATRRDRPIAVVARKILTRHHRKLRKAGKRLAELAPRPRHKLRIDAKKLRYACGFFSGLYSSKAEGKRLRRFVAVMEDLQDRLGALTDIEAADSLTAELATAAATRSDAAAKLAFAAGVIAGERQTGEAKAMRSAEKALARFAEAPRFW
jgi:triphosphatase